MSISKLELLDAIERIAPSETAEKWDNCGMQVATGAEVFSKVLVALEITGSVIDEAISLGADFILTHHPLIFSAIKTIDSSSITGNYLARLIKSGISVYSAHTSFDKAPRGNNFYLAQLMGLQDVKDFAAFGDYIGLFGRLPERKPVEQIARELEGQLGISRDCLRIAGKPGAYIDTVGLCTGAGAEMLDIARLSGCQLFVTGDVKYHDAMKAKETGIHVIDAGHYGTEKIFVPNMAAQLRALTGNKVEAAESGINLNPFDFL